MFLAVIDLCGSHHLILSFSTIIKKNGRMDWRGRVIGGIKGSQLLEKVKKAANERKGRAKSVSAFFLNLINECLVSLSWLKKPPPPLPQPPCVYFSLNFNFNFNFNFLLVFFLSHTCLFLFHLTTLPPFLCLPYSQLNLFMNQIK